MLGMLRYAVIWGMVWTVTVIWGVVLTVTVIWGMVWTVIGVKLYAEWCGQ